MADQLLPYGSSRFMSQIAKVGPPIKINFFEPYGASDRADLLTKVGSFDVPLPPPKTRTPRAGKVRRLNAGKG